MPSVTEILDTMDYSTAPESNVHGLAWLKQHEAGFGHFINGAFTKPSGKSFDVVNPANNQKFEKGIYSHYIYNRILLRPNRIAAILTLPYSFCNLKSSPQLCATTRRPLGKSFLSSFNAISSGVSL